ncbi:hypothetical protein MtrunA17_Chr5g0427721 [Medicago truncatula]|uniref:Uncharacterized protein n=1 Tax=Medicago truncatula TaxID=3880 RepID=G7JYG2_MEDTR|nr:hypothetical protein MTR_5g066590 [Medicago truncatula]RHN56278.1 hypothetical protein MtrunA17_Chr5g0427721 [Medicago truncatula]
MKIRRSPPKFNFEYIPISVGTDVAGRYTDKVVHDRLCAVVERLSAEIPFKFEDVFRHFFSYSSFPHFSGSDGELLGANNQCLLETAGLFAEVGFSS